jgi:hypothetical protein
MNNESFLNHHSTQERTVKNQFSSEITFIFFVSEQ